MERDVSVIRTMKKARWSDEERMRMAQKEASLLLEGHRLVNHLLENAFPHRTLEAIKGQRRRADYSEAVQRFRISISDGPAVNDNLSPANTSRGSILTEGSHSLPLLRSYLGSLPPLQGSDFHVASLNRIMGRMSFGRHCPIYLGSFS